MTKQRDYTPETVPFAATPAGEPPAIAQWANSFVWTDRMLATLCSGKVRGGKWIRMRLRSILRKRQKKRGRGRGKDHQKWTNHFFAEHGLYSLGAAHTRVCQSSPR